MPTKKTSPRGHTRDDLLAIARSRGFNPSARLITDWIDVGLIDRPTKRGLGRGRGTIATWPDTQLQLFLLVLEKRDAGAKRVATLCNIPVGIWLYWGDTYAPLRQVRRALSTWSKANTGGRWASERAAKDAARELVDQLADQSATDEDREHVINTIGALGYRVATGHPINREPLVTALNRILPPSDAKTPPLGEMYADLLHARITAMSRLDEATDELYQFARAQLRIGNHEYAAMQPRLAADPSLARIANRRDATSAQQRLPRPRHPARPIRRRRRQGFPKPTPTLTGQDPRDRSHGPGAWHRNTGGSRCDPTLTHAAAPRDRASTSPPATPFASTYREVDSSSKTASVGNDVGASTAAPIASRASSCTGRPGRSRSTRSAGSQRREQPSSISTTPAKLQATTATRRQRQPVAATRASSRRRPSRRDRDHARDPCRQTGRPARGCGHARRLRCDHHRAASRRPRRLQDARRPPLGRGASCVRLLGGVARRASAVRHSRRRTGSGPLDQLHSARLGSHWFTPRSRRPDLRDPQLPLRDPRSGEPRRTPRRWTRPRPRDPAHRPAESRLTRVGSHGGGSAGRRRARPGTARSAPAQPQGRPRDHYRPLSTHPATRSRTRCRRRPRGPWHLAPHAETVARLLAEDAGLTAPATTLTGTTRRHARPPSQRGRQQEAPTPAITGSVCSDCGAAISPARKRCSGCHAITNAGRLRTQQADENARRRTAGLHPSQDQMVRDRIAQTQRHRWAASKATEPASGFTGQPSEFRRLVLPRLSGLTPRELAAKTGLSPG